MMKMKDTRSKRFEMRLTEEEYESLLLCADYVGRTPTQFVRLLLLSSFVELHNRLEEQNNENQ